MGVEAVVNLKRVAISAGVVVGVPVAGAALYGLGYLFTYVPGWMDGTSEEYRWATAFPAIIVVVYLAVVLAAVGWGLKAWWEWVRD